MFGFYSRWLAELGPMFFSVKDSNFSQRDKRRQDRQQTMEMEIRLEKALAKKRADELRAQSEVLVTKTRFATPGSRPSRPLTGRPGSSRPRTGGSTPRRIEPSTPRTPRGI